MCLYALLHLLLTNSKLENSILVILFDEDKMNNYYKKGLHIVHLTNYQQCNGRATSGYSELSLLQIILTENTSIYYKLYIVILYNYRLTDDSCEHYTSSMTVPS